IGLSPALGAFIAGVVLASSEYKHTLEADIDPFKSLLLGLFFISVGMGMDFGLLSQQAMPVLGAVMALVAIKMAVLLVLGRGFGLPAAQNILFSFAMAQGGEFAFVLLQYASGMQVLPEAQARFLVLTVALSMATTPFLMMAASRWVLPRFMSQLPVREADVINERNSVIIAGYGRFGQIIGRFLRGQGVEVTVLEIDPEQIDLIRKFGGKGYFGDASRLDLLHSAGAENARMLVVAVDNADKALEIVRMARRNFPGLTVFARARNRRHAYELDKAGAHLFLRETFDTALRMAQEVMVQLGYKRTDMEYKAAQFKAHDESTLRKSFEFFEQEPELISFAQQARHELERILSSDIGDSSEEPKSATS
ncbi:MAG: potassium transporter, partial [Proteobacteria bacterium]|nr:potassium transporter [Pseudomonadota bacterium]